MSRAVRSSSSSDFLGSDVDEEFTANFVLTAPIDRSEAHKEAARIEGDTVKAKGIEVWKAEVQADVDAVLAQIADRKKKKAEKDKNY